MHNRKKLTSVNLNHLSKKNQLYLPQRHRELSSDFQMLNVLIIFIDTQIYIYIPRNQYEINFGDLRNKIKENKNTRKALGINNSIKLVLKIENGKSLMKLH